MRACPLRRETLLFGIIKQSSVSIIGMSMISTPWLPAHKARQKRTHAHKSLHWVNQGADDLCARVRGAFSCGPWAAPEVVCFRAKKNTVPPAFRHYYEVLQCPLEAPDLKDGGSAVQVSEEDHR